MTRHCYGLELAPVPTTLLRPVRVHRFASREARQHWIGCGYPGMRYVVRSSNNMVRWANRADAWGSDARRHGEAEVPVRLPWRW